MNNNNKRKISKAAFNAQNAQMRRAPRPGTSIKTLNGGKFIPSDDPPVITACPWNTVTIDTTVTFGKTLGYFKQSDLKNACIAQLGFTDVVGVNFEYRLVSCSLWAYNNTPKTEFFRISAYPMSLIGDKGVELTRLESNAVKNKFAKIGYHYPMTHTSLVKSTNSNDTELMAFVASEENCSGFLHFKIYWRGSRQGFASTVMRQHLVWVPVKLKPRVKEDDVSEETYDNVELGELFDQMAVRDERALKDISPVV